MTASIEKKAPVKTEVKKRTIYKQKSMIEFPDWAKNDHEHKYRWVSKRRVSRSDGFDPRGWMIARDPKTNESLEAFDLILHKMPLEEWNSMKDFKDDAARTAIQHVLEAIEGKQDRLRYEVERMLPAAASRLSQTEFSIERKA